MELQGNNNFIDLTGLNFVKQEYNGLIIDIFLEKLSQFDVCGLLRLLKRLWNDNLNQNDVFSVEHVPIASMPGKPNGANFTISIR